MRWQYRSGFGFAINSGCFISPVGPKREGTYAPAARPSEQLLERAFTTRESQPFSESDRRDAAEDQRAWRADAVVVDPRLPDAEALRITAERLYGAPARLVGGMFVWNVRSG